MTQPADGPWPDPRPAGSHFIDGAAVEDGAGRPFATFFPADGSTLARLFGATDDVRERALAAATRAQPVWAAMAPVDRGRVLMRAAALLRERNEALSRLETLDTGKPLQETRVADAASGADCLEFFGGLIAAEGGRHIPLGPEGFAYTRREPLGVVLGIGAWNYPMQIACWKAAPALAAGNAMIFKPSEVTPLSALKLAEILIEAGLPPGVFNVVQGMGETAAALAASPRIAKVSLTGSVPTGRKVAAAAGEALKPVTMELGGKSPILVFDDASLEDAVGGALLGNFYSTGQVCSNGTRVFVQAGLHDAFVARLVERTRAIRLGDPRDPRTQMGPLVTSRQRDQAMAAVEAGRAAGARLECGGTAASPTGAEAGWFMTPAVFSGVTDDMALARDEIFGPVLSVLKFETEEEAIARANATEFGLAAGVFTQDLARGHRVAERLQAGTCWINAYNLTPVQMPFGGVKASGWGRENSAAALDAYSTLKSVYVSAAPVDSPY
ncbi:MAG: betaine-aldehyde dehydrogenase [Pseudomonadota bacterium]